MFSILEDNTRATRLGSRRGLSRGARWLLVLCALWPFQALGQHTHSHDTPPPRSTQERQARAGGRPGVIKTQTALMKIPDTALINQHGKKMRFYSELVKGKVVVLSFFFTSCANVCLGQGIALKSLKARLGERFGKDVFFISVSKDPERDTPAELKRWGLQFGVAQGWMLLTGKKDAINTLALGLTGEEAASAMHSPILLIGNDRTGVWTQASADSTTEELIGAIQTVMNATAISNR